MLFQTVAYVQPPCHVDGRDASYRALISPPLVDRADQNSGPIPSGICWVRLFNVEMEW